jgi:hypothetical protein
VQCVHKIGSCFWTNLKCYWIWKKISKLELQIYKFEELGSNLNPNQKLTKKKKCQNWKWKSRSIKEKLDNITLILCCSFTSSNLGPIKKTRANFSKIWKFWKTRKKKGKNDIWNLEIGHQLEPNLDLASKHCSFQFIYLLFKFDLKCFFRMIKHVVSLGNFFIYKILIS